MSVYSVLILSFFFIIIIGTILLSLPVASFPGKRPSVIDSLFIATSAVTVTGLVITDINYTFTLFGKTVLIILVQLGGLGVMTFSSVIVLFLTHKIDYTAKKIIQKDLNYNTLFNIQSYIKNLIKIVFLIEFIGAFCLFFVFIKKFSFLKAVYYAVFHSISAFCNTGFSLFPGSLSEYRTNIPINLIIPMLITLGSLGFTTLNSIYTLLFPKFKSDKKRIRLTLTARLSVIVSLILIILGTVLTLLIEMSNPDTLKNFVFHDKLLLSFFQSVSIRTAGFQTLDLIHMRKPTLIFYMILMFIGASPGSTGGGIKTTTIAVITLGVYTTLSHRKNIEFHKREISWGVFNRAIAIVFISIIYIFVIVFTLSYIEKNQKFILLLFEVISAFGTAGLSLDITPVLTPISKILISLTMFLGRVGPLTVAMALTMKRRKKGTYSYPVDKIQIGC
nr:potassium transporter TrkG [Sebaldella sp. S0638]